MKRLSHSTRRRYTIKQLAKHLERVMDAHWTAGEHPYRVDTAYGWIRVKEGDCYLCYCPLNRLNRAELIEAIDQVWRSIERR
jgi:Zn-finger protein